MPGAPSSKTILDLSSGSYSLFQVAMASNLLAMELSGRLERRHVA